MFPQGSAAANRKDEFKTGLGDTEAVVKRHAEKARALGREKRDDKIQRMRNRNHYEPNSQTMFELSQVIAMRDAYIATQSLESIQYLKHFMHVSKAEAVNEILCVPFVDALMRSISAANYAGVMCAAADCLVNATAELSDEHIPLIGKAILARPEFYAVLNQHLCNNDSPIRFDMWKVLANLACMCQDAREAMLKSCVFVVPPASTRPAPPGGSTPLPIFASEFDKRDPATLPMLLVLLMGICASPDAVIPEPFMMAHWRRVVGLLPLFLPDPQREEEPMELLEYTLTVIQKTLEKATPERAVQMVALEPALVTFTVGLYKRVNQINYNHLHVMRILVMLSKFNTPQHEFLLAMRNAGCIPLMAQLSVNANERIQKEALMWIGNYAAEGHEFVAHLLEYHAFDGVVEFLRRAPKQSVLDQVLYVLTAAVKACCRRRDAGFANFANSAPAAPSSQDTLRALLVEKHFLSFTTRYVGQKGCDTRTCDILSMWVMLLKWDKAYVLPILESTHGLDRVDELLGSPNVAIYKLASQVDDLVHAGMDTMED